MTDSLPAQFNRSYALRGNSVCDAPASRDAGASFYGFPRRAWEPWIDKRLYHAKLAACQHLFLNGRAIVA